jgi:hypothetical protein
MLNKINIYCTFTENLNIRTSSFMKYLNKNLLSFLIIIPFIFTSCSNDDEVINPVTELNSKIYTLETVGAFGVSGTAKFIENSDATLSIELDLQNTPANGMHPAHVHFNTAAESGGIALSLDAVSGDTGKSTTTFTMLNDGTSISYQGLLDFDGYINVHLSTQELSTLVAQGDIGQNELTDVSKVYALGSAAVPAIDGTATFYKRVNGEALAVIELSNTPEDGEHPGHIHMNTAAESGEIAFTFNTVNGNTGISKTNVDALDDGSTFGYDEMLDYNGYINIHLSATELSTLVAQGDIGQNELTGEKISYALDEGDRADISGTIEFSERINETTLVTINLTGTPTGGSHPAHIHENDVATSGGVIVGLNPVNGDTGISKTQVAALVGGSAVTYTELLTIDAYVNVHFSDADLTTIVAQGNIGSNAGADSKTYDVTNSGSSAYIFNGEGLSDSSNPNFTFRRGSTYTFNINTPGHPFYINDVQGTGTANTYNSGVTGNGATADTITFTVPADAPNTLYYNCEFHSSMSGMITITD